MNISNLLNPRKNIRKFVRTKIFEQEREITARIKGQSLYKKTKRTNVRPRIKEDLKDEINTKDQP